MSDISIINDLKDISLISPISKSSPASSQSSQRRSISNSNRQQTGSSNAEVTTLASGAESDTHMKTIVSLNRNESIEHNHSHTHTAHHHHTTTAKVPFLSTAVRAERRLNALESPKSNKIRPLLTNSNINIHNTHTSSESSPKSPKIITPNRKINQTPKRFVSQPINPNASFLKATSASLNRIKDIGKDHSMSSTHHDSSNGKLQSILSNDSKSFIHSKFKNKIASTMGTVNTDSSITRHREFRISIDSSKNYLKSGFKSQPQTPNTKDILHPIQQQKDTTKKIVSNSSISSMDRKKINRRSLNLLDYKTNSIYPRKKSIPNISSSPAVSNRDKVSRTIAPSAKSLSNINLQNSRRNKVPSPPKHTTRSVEKINDVDKMYECLSSHSSTAEIVKSWKMSHLIIDPNHTPSPRFPKEVSDLPNNLNSYEKGEIMRKTEIYFTGLPNITKSTIDISNFSKNFGFDDDDKNYLALKGDHIDYRYEILGFLGNGSFGNVLRCKDHKFNRIVAIKIIKNDMTWSLQAAYEIKMLKILLKEKQSKLSLNKENGNENGENFILDYYDHFHFRSHMCISTELLGINLYQVIESTNFKGFSIPIIQIWSKQILQALNFIHKKGIIHCDLKPENIMLISPNGLDIKIIDFGSACFNKEISYSYIQSRFYRAPEVLLGARYDNKIDLWSFGCLIVELFSGDPLFPGTNEIEQVGCILQVFGPPSSRYILELRNEIEIKGPVDSSETARLNLKKNLLYCLFDSSGKLRLEFLHARTKKRIRPSSKKIEILLKARGLAKEDSRFIDFVSRVLNWDLHKRPSCEELLTHGFLTKKSDFSRVGTPIHGVFVNSSKVSLADSPLKNVEDVTDSAYSIDNSISGSDTPSSQKSSVSDTHISIAYDDL